MDAIETQRLRLIPLSRRQLELYLGAPEELERELGFLVSRSVLTERVRHAIEVKLTKMARADAATHAWYTYWLIVVAGAPFGAGLAGFKGAPSAGEAEIGYGIDPAYQGRGYVTETVRALIAWAFQEPACRAVVAPGTLKTNIASNRVLAKVGMTVYAETDSALSWAIERAAMETSSHV
jgi:[ribosomal protein S5]-alanine N-acetyltransferase